VVIDDLDNLHLVRPFHGLGQLVVVHENEPPIHFFQKVGLREESDHPVFLVHHRKRVQRGLGRLPLGVIQPMVALKGQVLGAEDVAHGHGGAAQIRGGRSVVRRNDHTDSGFLGCVERALFHAQSTGNDYATRLLANRQILNIPTVTDNHHEAVGFVFVQTRSEGLVTHRADHHGEFLLVAEAFAMQTLAAERLHQAVQGRKQAAGIRFTPPIGHENPAQLEHGDQPGAGSIRAQYWQHPQATLVHDGKRLGHGRVWFHAHDILTHDIRNLRGHIRDEPGRGYAEMTEYEIDPVVGVTTTGRNGLRHAGAAFEFGIAEGGTDGVGIRVAVSDDEDFTHVRSRGRSS